MSFDTDFKKRFFIQSWKQTGWRSVIDLLGHFFGCHFYWKNHVFPTQIVCFGLSGGHSNIQSADQETSFIFSGKNYKIILLKKAPGQQRLNWHFAPATYLRRPQISKAEFSCFTYESIKNFWMSPLKISMTKFTDQSFVKYAEIRKWSRWIRPMSLPYKLCSGCVVNWQFEKSFHFLYDHLMCSRREREREERKTFNYQLDECPARKKKEIKWKMDFGSWKIMLFCCVMNIFLSPMKHVNGSNLKVFFLLSLSHSL